MTRHDLKSRSQCTHTPNPCPGNKSLLPCWIWILFQTIILYNPSVLTSNKGLIPKGVSWPVSHNCYSWPKGASWPWSEFIYQGQGQIAHIPKVCVRAIIPRCHVGSGQYYTQWLSVIHGWVIILTQGNISTVMVKYTHNQNPCQILNILLSCWIWMIFYTIASWLWLPDVRIIAYISGCLYIFLIYCFYHLTCLCNNFMVSTLQLAVGPRRL